MQRLTSDFFTQDPVHCARELIGCQFHWNGCSGKIVETEAYRATGDEACHTWFRPSSRDFMKRQQAGDAYVYLSYGVHWLFNILVRGEQDGFVLLRALEPRQGIEAMRSRRGNFPNKLLMAGPGRLTQAMGIDGEDHGSSFLTNGTGAIEAGAQGSVIAGPRIGISKAIDLPWRFGDPNSKCLSKNFPVK